LAAAGYTAPMKVRPGSIPALVALAWGIWSQNLFAGEATAFTVAKAGDAVIEVGARGKITEMRSEKTGTNLVPNVWYVDYFDTNTAFKTTEVMFVDGKVKEVTQPKHVFQAFSGSRKLSWRKLKVDSDKALAIALKNRAFQTYPPKAVQFRLERTTDGSIWKIRFWTPRNDQPGETVDIGELYISTQNGEVIKDDLWVRRAN
jgi:hypothetical protein